MEKICDIVAEKGGIITVDDTGGKALYKRILRAVDRGELIRVRHGVYADPAALFNTMIDIEKIIPDGVVCLYNAWSYYNLTTSIPPAFCVAIEAKRKVALPANTSIQLYYWKKEFLEFGITNREVSGYKIRMTDIERSVCDAIRYRNKIGMDICAEIIRTYLKRSDRNLSRLSDYAKRLRVSKTLSNIIEIALE